ncbi:MAG TPA: lipid-A-disaccharide synthase [Woeseiaceae bacterium]|nr:lipid-A-disaccharide synthase [Woeseiaceae bacterium]
MKFALVAGEASGDLLGAGLIQALAERVPGATFEGVAGPEMKRAGCHAIADAEVLAVMGLIEPLRRVPALLRLRRALVHRWRGAPPDVFIGIDAPDFNLGLELRLKRAGIPVAHYVSPSVWAWRQGRVRKIRDATDCVMCILPFEKTFYDKHDVNAVFVGHPTADSTPDFIDTRAARAELGLDGDKPVVAVLPGSRVTEVTRHAPIFAEACARLRDTDPHLRFVCPVAAPQLRAPIVAALAGAGVSDSFLLQEGQSRLVMSAADVVMLASGTAALESALLQKPTVAAYRVAESTAWIIRIFGLLKVTSVTLPNQLTEKPLVPELIQWQVTAEALAHEVGSLLGDPARRASISARFAKLKNELAIGSNQRAAEAVLALVDQ